MGRGKTCARIEGNLNSNCCVRESIIKLFRKVASIVTQWVNLSTTLPCKVAVKSLGSRSSMRTLFCLLRTVCMYLSYVCHIVTSEEKQQQTKYACCIYVTSALGLSSTCVYIHITYECTCIILVQYVPCVADYCP